MYIDDLTRLKHMRDAAEEVRQFVSDKTRSDLDTDSFAIRGLVRTPETVGEAASRISRNYRDGHPQIEWQEWISFRHHLVHDYFDYDPDQIWRVATVGVTTLLTPLRALIDDLG